VKRDAVLVAACALTAAAGCNRVIDSITVSSCTGSTDPSCAPSAWPTPGHTANSDPWLVSHNRVITSMKPVVLILNFDAGMTADQTRKYATQVVTALGAGSNYHDYANASTTPFLNYQILNVIDLTSVTIPVTVDSPLTMDLTALFTDPQFPPLYGYADPTAPSGYLTMCQLFEKGLVNEVWIQDGGDAMTTPRAPLYAEQKQQYDADGHAIPGAFISCLGGGNVSCLNVSCGVTVRFAHLDPAPSGGPGCDVQVRGWGIDAMWKMALPSLATDANAFLNMDFDTRFNAPFAGWSPICSGGSICVSYPSPTVARNPPGATIPFTFDPFLQGCGSSVFPANATFRADFENTGTVNSRCEHFGLADDGNGHDTYMPYASTITPVANDDQTYSGTSACPAGWQIYWRQSMPGYQNQAIGSDGNPMPNWWPILFY
jgi:hypothetical protein